MGSSVVITRGDTGTNGADGYASTTLNISISDGGSEIVPGIKGWFKFDQAVTIEKVTLLADQSGDLVCDLWIDTITNYPPTDADSITAAAPPTLTAETWMEDDVLTGWTTSIAVGDVLMINVDSCNTITAAVLAIKVRRV